MWQAYLQNMHVRIMKKSICCHLAVNADIPVFTYLINAIKAL